MGRGGKAGAGSDTPKSREDRNSLVYALTGGGGLGVGGGSWVEVEGGAGADQIWKIVG